MSSKQSAVSIGKFECLHRGHQQLIINMKAQEENGLRSTMLIVGSQEEKQLLTREERSSLLTRMGVERELYLDMNETLRAMEPEDFVKEVLVDRLHTRYVTAGVDFRFGHHRRGDGALLKDLSKRYGFEVDLVEKETQDGKEISSSWVREALTAGDIPLVNKLLGYRYSIAGKVMQGNRLGRKLGMPTLNILPGAEKLLPPNGVYASLAVVEGHLYRGVTNIGLKPTIAETRKQLGVETHLFGFDRELYGTEISVSLCVYLRPERKFPDISCLKRQISRDIDAGKQYFSQIL